VDGLIVVAGDCVMLVSGGVLTSHWSKFDKCANNL